MVRALLAVLGVMKPVIWAASCCGGGSASSLTLSKFNHQMVDMSLALEQYDGYWDQQGNVKKDPPGSDLQQVRLNLGYAQRLASRWQSHVILPVVWNDNSYGSLQSKSQGLGDVQLGLLYESFDGIKCVYRVNEWKDLVPSTYWGLSLTVPTGISPYDDEKNSFDITGRGFYRLDGSLLLEKTIYPWTARVSSLFGYHFERPIQEEYGQAVAPYDRQLGHRWSGGIGGGYSKALPSLWTLTGTLDLQQIREGDEKINGQSSENSGSEKTSLALGLSTTDVLKKWIVKTSWNHALSNSHWGRNFPITDTYIVGCSYVFR